MAYVMIDKSVRMRDVHVLPNIRRIKRFKTKESALSYIKRKNIERVKVVKVDFRKI